MAELNIDKNEAFALAAAVHDRIEFLKVIIEEQKNELLLLQILEKKIKATI